MNITWYVPVAEFDPSAFLPEARVEEAPVFRQDVGLCRVVVEPVVSVSSDGEAVFLWCGTVALSDTPYEWVVSS